MDCRIEPPNGCFGRIDLRLPNVVGQVSLGCDVGEVHHVEIDQLQSRHTDGSELKGHVSANSPDADHRDGDSRQAVPGHDILLPGKPIVFSSHRQAAFLLDQVRSPVRRRRDH